MSATVSNLPAVVIPAPEKSAFVSGLKKLQEETAELRRKAAVVGITLGNFPNGWDRQRVETAYAAYVAKQEFTAAEQAEYNQWVDEFNAEREAEIAAREDEAAEDMGRIEQFA